jgi:hypothetical protein
MTEKELLNRFAMDRGRDAFRMPLERHEPMVRADWRRVLNDVDDVEDPYPDTFLPKPGEQARLGTALASMVD